MVLYPQTVTRTERRCSGTPTSALASGGREPPSDMSHIPWEANVPSQLAGVWKGIFLTAVTSHFERTHLSFFPTNEQGSVWAPAAQVVKAETAEDSGQ